MKNKICVYAICKNEANFVEQWYKSMSEADCIVVLDTGSTDDTVEKLEKLGVKVEQKIIKPWRFDTARNESLNLVPNDCNILVCTDLDEVFEPGWAKILKDNWIDGKHSFCWYKYVWSHYDNDREGHVFWYNKIHAPNYYEWKYPIHEGLVIKKEYEEIVNNLEPLTINDGIKLHHYPIDKETRNNYLSLLETRLNEYPNEINSYIYLARQYLMEKQYEKCIKFIDETFKKNILMSPIEKAALYLYKGDCYYNLNQIDEAINSYKDGIESDITYRENYISLAEALLKTDNEFKFLLAYNYLKKALNNTFQHYHWLERTDTYTEKIYDLLSLTAYYSDNKNDSLLYAFIARELNPKDKRLNDNLNLIFNEVVLKK